MKGAREYCNDDHKRGKRKMEDMDVFTFIGRMVQHILPKGMQWIRYYGLYATAVYQKIRKNYQQRVIETSSKDPFVCSRCGGALCSL